MKLIVNNAFMDACREAYRNSSGARKIREYNEGAPVNKSREPGQDDDLPLGIARDPLEQEFMDAMQP